MDLTPENLLSTFHIIPIQDGINDALIKNKLINEETHKICFSLWQRNALKKNNNNSEHTGTFNVPFIETIGPIFHQETNLTLFLNRNKWNGYWLAIQSEKEYKRIEQFIDKYKDIILIKDCLALSIALSINMNEKQKYTNIGLLEHKAKYENDNRSLNLLVTICSNKIRELPFYKGTNTIIAVPSKNNDQSSLPEQIVSRIAVDHNITSLNGCLEWTKKKVNMKEKSREEKRNALNDSGLIFNNNYNDEKGDIILFDDLYQSGLTMQYTASVLLQSGFKRIFGLSIVKSWSDSDNKFEQRNNSK